MTTRTVTGTVLRADGQPWAGARVRFELDRGSFTSTATYPPDQRETTTNEDGQFSVSLWTNAEGSLPSCYRCVLPNGDTFDFVLPAGASSIGIEALRLIDVAAHIWTDPGVSLLDEHAGVSASASQLGHIKIGAGLTVAGDGTVSVTGGGGGGVSDHGALTGLAEDDHPQYLTEGRGDARYSPLGHTHPYSPLGHSHLLGDLPVASSGQPSSLALVRADDSRLNDARTPSAHSTSHQHGGADEIGTATPAAHAIPKAGADSRLAAGWLPASVAQLPINLASGVTGVLPMANGGSGVSVRPAFVAYLNTSQSGIAASTFTKIQLDTVAFDQSSMYSLTTKRATVATSGAYLFVCALELTFPTDQGRIILSLYKNGARYRESHVSVSGTTYYGCNLVATDVAAATDYYEMYVWHTCSTAQQVYGSALTTYFSGVLLG